LLRGKPTEGLRFHDNVLVHDDQDSAISLKNAKNDTGLDEDTSEFNIAIAGDTYDTDYTREIAAGDFDGDGHTDVFLATGTAWFMSRDGIRPWEFLRASNKRTIELGFADIDNDGITDVVYRDPVGNVGYVHSGTAAALTPLTMSPVAMKDLRFGDFDGDGRTDMFYTLNGQWRIWYGRTRQWTNAQTSVTPISELLFGEFDNVKGTDVAAVKDLGWAYSSAGTGTYVKLNNRLTGSFAGAVAADFDGNGKTDIAYGDGTTWTISFGGTSALTTLRSGAAAPPLRTMLVGHFEGNKYAQVVSFDPTGLYLSAWLNHREDGNLHIRSTQAMR
jgi:hypothetical protein